MAPKLAPPYDHMHAGLRLAACAGQRGEVPIAALVVSARRRIIAAAANATEHESNPLAHAEMIAIARAQRRLGKRYLVDCTMYVTLAPCVMCAGAISLARVQRLYIATDSDKRSGIEALYQQPWVPEIYEDVAEQRAQQLLGRFFAARR